MTKYTSIEQGDSNDDEVESHTTSINRTRPTRIVSNKHKTLIGGFVAVVVCLAVVITTGNGNDNGNDNIVNIGSASAVEAAAAAAAAASSVVVVVTDNDDDVRDCTFKECYDTACDKKIAPFICERINGGPMGGCSPTPWIVGTCDDQCSLSDCHKLPIPSDMATCKDVQCSDEWCDTPQLCGPDVPYQCVNGSGRFGCQDDPLGWTLRSSDTVCSECCDITTC